MACIAEGLLKRLATGLAALSLLCGAAQAQPAGAAWNAGATAAPQLPPPLPQPLPQAGPLTPSCCAPAAPAPQATTPPAAAAPVAAAPAAPARRN